jgi:hypothetical protein
MTFGGGNGQPINPIDALGIKALVDIANQVKSK